MAARQRPLKISLKCVNCLPFNFSLLFLLIMTDWIAWRFYWYNVGKQIVVENSFLLLEMCSVLVSLSSFANIEIWWNMNNYSYDALLYGKQSCTFILLLTFYWKPLCFKIKPFGDDFEKWKSVLTLKKIKNKEKLVS